MLLTHSDRARTTKEQKYSKSPSPVRCKSVSSFVCPSINCLFFRTKYQYMFVHLSILSWLSTIVLAWVLWLCLVTSSLESRLSSCQCLLINHRLHISFTLVCLIPSLPLQSGPRA